MPLILAAIQLNCVNPEKSEKATYLFQSKVNVSFLDISSNSLQLIWDKNGGVHTSSLPILLYSHIFHSYTVHDLNNETKMYISAPLQLLSSP